MVEGHTPQPVEGFNGLWARGENENVPLDHQGICQNVKFLPGGITTRDGTEVDIELPLVRRYHNYEVAGLAPRKIILTEGGVFYDSLNLNVPLITIPNAIDFSMVVWNQFAFISPHDRVRGLSGEVVYVYDGQKIRPTGGQSPIGFTLGVATSSNSGKVEKGKHLFAVALETKSGFITKMGPDVWTEYDAPGEHKVTLSNIPIGNEDIIARHIVASKVLGTTYTGVQTDIEMFFVEGGRIDDNITTDWEVDFYDSDLIRSADHLLDQRGVIPACLGLGVYKNMLMGWNTQTHENLIMFSRPNEPESMDQIEGYMEIKDDEKRQGVKNCVEYRQQLFIHKANRTYVTEASTEPPAYWRFDSIDKAVGTEINGIAKIVDVEGSTTDIYSLIDRSGIRAFTGTFSGELTYKIRKLWDRVNKAYLNTAQYFIDATTSKMYITLPIDGANSPNILLYGDYVEGFDAFKIKWSIWTFPFSPTSIGLDLDESGIPFLSIGSQNDNIHKMSSVLLNDIGTAIDWKVRFGYVGKRSGATHHYGGIRVRAKGNGILRPAFVVMGDETPIELNTWTLESNPRKYLERGANVQAPLAALELSTTLINEKVIVEDVIVYHNTIWMGVL